MSNIVRNKLSKSNGVEIIAILYFILATQLDGWTMWVAFTLGVLNVLESITWSMVFKSKDEWRQS